MIDNHDFILDSLFCEYVYIINLDTNMLECWKGFQTIPNKGNRYGQECNENYYPCDMVALYELNDITGATEDNIEKIYKDMCKKLG